MTIMKKDVVRVARTYLGVKFRMHGRDKTGLDCIGLLYRVLTDLGFELGDFNDYGRAPEVKKLEAVLDQYSRTVNSNVPRNGQVVKIRQYIFPMHLGIVVVEAGQASMIHASVKKHKVVEEAFTDWVNNIIEHREIIGVR